MPFLITPAWRNFLVACYAEARFEESDPKIDDATTISWAVSTFLRLPGHAALGLPCVRMAGLAP